ncbi:unnamed protein product [Lupinus luteus]|uniref:Uncharacterized protein n=1 Tax=Lupinus luteus TaxID=3873 RepID=A0AAV1XE81_LUPLU
MMRRLRLCCEGADIYLENEPKEERSEQYHKSKDASVFPAKRKNVKKMACKCFVNCIFGKCKCMKTNTNTISPHQN